MHLNSRGVGLGLSISNALAKLLGPNQDGGIKINSIPNIGSTFSFSIVQKFGFEIESPLSCSLSGSRSMGVDSFYYPDFLDNIDENPRQEADPLVNESEIEFRALIPKKYSTSKTLVSNRFIQYKEETKTDQEIQYKEMINTTTSQNTIQIICNCPKILVVDDDCFNILAIESLMRIAGVKCECAYNGKEGIEKVLKRQETRCSEKCKPYSVIFMDCSMPVMDGFEASRWLREKMKEGIVQEVKIIGCTAFTDEQKINECMLTMDEVISKPLDRAKLRRILKTYLKS